MRRSTQQDTLRAKDAAEIKPLLELCRAGRLFEVQAWIAAGKPLNSPINSKRRAVDAYRCQSPQNSGIFELLVDPFRKCREPSSSMVPGITVDSVSIA